MEDRTTFFMLVATFAWGWYRWFRSKNETAFYALCMGTMVILLGYPVHAPIELVCTIWALFGCVVVSYKIHKKQVNKSLRFIPLMLFAFALLFLSQLSHSRTLDLIYGRWHAAKAAQPSTEKPLKHCHKESRRG